MLRTCFILLFTLVGAAIGSIRPAGADHLNPGPKILLHVSPATTRDRCSTNIPTCCVNAVTHGKTNVDYLLYVLAVPSDSMWKAGDGIAGIQFGIGYQGQYEPGGAGALTCVFSWTLCATLEFPSPYPAWPNPGSGTIITWNLVTTCQRNPVAVAGYFYMAAYSTDSFRVIERPVDHAAKMVSCQLVEKRIVQTLLHSNDLARVTFTPTGVGWNDGNPCSPPCPVVPVIPATWSRIKAHDGR